jgi:hypothetical protein
MLTHNVSKCTCRNSLSPATHALDRRPRAFEVVEEPRRRPSAAFSVARGASKVSLRRETGVRANLAEADSKGRRTVSLGGLVNP